MAYESNKGISHLAAVLAGRMNETFVQPIPLDLAELDKNGNLIANTFPVPIPKEDYMVCSGCRNRLGTGVKVLIAWVQNEVVVIDTVKKGDNT